MDYTAILGAVSVTTTLAAIAAAGAIKIQPGFMKWAANKLIGWFR